MNNWETYILGELIKCNKRSISNNYPFNTILYLDTGSITEGKVQSFQQLLLSDAPSRAKRLVEHEDIIYSTVRPIQKHYGFVVNPQPNLVVSTGFVTITCNKDLLYPKFLYYFLTNDETVIFLDVIAEASTSAYPSLKPSDIENLEISLPPLATQKAIAEVLSSLDDKIDLLHRQNKTLEQMAETLFRQWFIEEAGEDWKTLLLSEIAEIKNGFSFSSSNYIEYDTNSLEVFKMGHIAKGGGLRASPKKDYVPRQEKLSKYILNKGDIVMAMTDMKDNVVILGVPAIIDKSNHYVLNQRVARIYLKDNSKLINHYLLYLQLNNKENIAILQNKANSGVQVNLSTQTIKDIEIIVPPLLSQKINGETITNLYLKKENNLNQIKNLTKLRDTLLPKLISGEVSINQI